MLGALLWSTSLLGQAAESDTTKFAQAESLFWRGDSLAESGERPRLRQALALWRDAASVYAAGRHLEELASTFQHAAAVHSRLGSLDSAIAYHHRALSLRREVGDRSGEATALHYIAEANDEHGRPDTALVFYARALTILRDIEDGADEATTLDKIGGVHARLGHPDSALANYARALAIHRQRSDRPGEATTLNNIGAVHTSLGRPDSALAYFVAVLAIERGEADRLGEATTLSNIGLIHAKLGRPDSALAYSAQALSIGREVPDRAGEATTLNNIAAVHAELGQPDSALTSFARALAIMLEVGDRRGEATTLNNIGGVYDALSRPDSAFAYYAKALQIRRAVRDRAAEATTLNNIGAVHDHLGRPDSAMVYSALALGIHRQVRDRYGEASTLNNIGLAHARMGQPDSALAYFELTLPIQREVRNRAGEATTLNNIAAVHHDLGRPDSALAYYARSLPIHREVGNLPSEATTLNNTGYVHHRLGRADSALAYYASALRIERKVGYRYGEAATLHNIALALLELPGDGRTRSAVATFDSSAALRSRMRRSAGGDANAVSLNEIADETFTAWSRGWVRLAERARTTGDSAALTQAVSSSLAAAERGRAQALRDLLDRRAGASATGVDAADTIAGADLAAEASRLLAPLRESGTALLYYLADGDTLRTWFLGTGGALSVLSPVVQRNAELIDRIETARVRIGADEAAARQRRGEEPRRGEAAAFSARNDVTGADLDGDLVAAGAALLALGASVLPTGLETLLPPGVELVIVPHGMLGQVPFAVLTLPHDTLPLGLRNAIRYAPSLRSLVAAQAAGGPYPGTSAEKAHLRALVVGNPEMPRIAGKDGGSQQLSPLQGAAAEGAWVATRLGAPLLTGAAATERVVRDMLPAASIVHLATHGLAYGTEARVRDSYVALTPGAGHDGFLTLGELLDDDSIRLSADLIVLSACQTGLGEVRQAEGTVGLQRGLLAKGARSVLVSLWSVDDAATQMLMERFYTHWLGADNRAVIGKAEALRRAQADVRAVPSFYNPRYWAAFQLVGLQ
ncbi:MAG: CHAT domain-containing tetratricopeptide repeat protein [Gemmatimonadaceae bacterium]